ncbi:cytochrome P450 [Bisporella sp. PMI_857]|nr:cytochrome P450 [Bisporella sp. PMI_857]
MAYTTVPPGSPERLNLTSSHSLLRHVSLRYGTSPLPISPWIQAVFICVATWAIWFIFTRGQKRLGTKPPRVPSRLPIIGHAISFLLDNSDFLSWALSHFPNDTVKTINMASTPLHIVTSSAYASQIFKHEKTFPFEPLENLLFKTFGCSKRDLRAIEESGFGHKHRNYARLYLQGKHLDVIMDVFVSSLRASLLAEFKEGEDWKELDLRELTKKHFTLAGLETQFGSRFVERNGERLVDWLWEFDSQFTFLMAGLPDFINRKAARGRDEGLRMLVDWERIASSPERDEKNDMGETKADGEEIGRDEYWGSYFHKERHRLGVEAGMSERGRAALQLAFLWGASANVVPVATWFVLQSLIHPGLLSTLRSEIGDGQRVDGKGLEAGVMGSVLMECYRWSVYSPGVRSIAHDTNLGSYHIAKGGMAMVHSRTLQLNPQVWGDDYLEFNPYRFLENEHPSSSGGKSESQRKKEKAQNMRHFGGGAHLCPGRYAAGREILFGFKTLTDILEIEVEKEKLEQIGMPEADMKSGKQGGLWPDREFWVKVRRRGQ